MTRFADVKVPPEYWASSIMPAGVLETWLQPAGSEVKAGEPIAAIRVESMLHRLPDPASGVLQPICDANSVVDPGCVIGRISPHREA